MKVFYVRYADKDGARSTVWVNAKDAKDAEAQVRHDYWDVDKIISITTEW